MSRKLCSKAYVGMGKSYNYIRWFVWVRVHCELKMDKLQPWS